MKIKALSIITMLILLLAACGSDSNEDPVTGEQSEETVDEAAEDTDETEETVTGEPGVYPQLDPEVGENEPVVEMTTNKGVVTIKLFPDYAPKAVENRCLYRSGNRR